MPDADVPMNAEQLSDEQLQEVAGANPLVNAAVTAATAFAGNTLQEDPLVTNADSDAMMQGLAQAGGG